VEDGPMRKARYLAPWRREGAVELDAEALAALRGKPAIYHCVSRVVNRERVLGPTEKEHFVKLMRLYERFSQVRVLTFCVMSNHFHILVEIPAAPEDRGASWTDGEFLTHLGILYAGKKMKEIRWELEHFRQQGAHRAAEALRQRYFDRMWDLSAFMKTLKQRFTQWFNRVHDREGCLWSGRFKSVLVEDGHAARTMAAYIDLNPVRAGMVADPKDYRWSGYGEAVAGKATAREGLRLVVFEKLLGQMNRELAAKEVTSWREVVRRYRVVLFSDGRARKDGRVRKDGRDGRGGKDRAGGRAGISAGRVEQVLAQGGKLSEGELLRCRVRFFVDGLVLGSAGFVEEVYALSREHFGAGRKSGARKMKRAETDLRTMRDLRRDAIANAG
jgi:putative transposase